MIFASVHEKFSILGWIRTVILSLLLFLLPLVVLSQNKISLKGTIMDSINRKPVSFATVGVYDVADSSLLTYRLTEKDGSFTIGTVSSPIFRIVISHVGYHTFRTKPQNNLGGNGIDLGKILLSPKLQEMDEVIVTNEHPPVLVKNDTIEFYAPAFKTLPNALVEDLLKKFPGVMVDREGNITFNGKRVNRLFVEGREFFGTDPKIATKNLPAAVIEKVQMTPDQEQRALNPLLQENEVGVILNLTLKKSAKKGAFGKIYAGGGTEERRELGGLINVFRDTLQISFLGYHNNINAPAFGSNDLLYLGGFRRSSFNNMNLNWDGSVGDIDGLRFGGNNAGLPVNSGAGINASHQLGKNISLNGQYFFSYTGNVVDRLTNSRQFQGDTTFQTDINDRFNSSSYTHNIGMNLRARLSQKANLTFRPRFIINDDKNRSYQLRHARTNFKDPINESENQENTTYAQNSYTHDASYLLTNWGKAGRSLTLSNRLSYGDLSNDRLVNSDNQFFSPVDMIRLLQRRNAQTDNLNSVTSVNFTEPLSKTKILRFLHSSTVLRDKDNLFTYENDPLSPIFNQTIDSLSYVLNRNLFRTSNAILLDWAITPRVRLTGGVNYQGIWTKNTTDKLGRLSQNYSGIFPQIELNRRPWYIGYSATLREPKLTDLMPVVNNANPLYQIIGNPDLNPTVTHGFRGGYNNYIAKKLLSIFTTHYFDVIEDDVYYRNTLDENGIQTITAMNQPSGTFSYRTNSGFTKNYNQNKKNQFSVRLFFTANLTRKRIIFNQRIDWQRLWQLTPMLDWNMNLNNKLEIAQRYSLTSYYTSYQQKLFDRRQVSTHNITTSITARVAKGVTIDNHVTVQRNTNVDPTIQNNFVLWNAGIKYSFLKNEILEVKLSAFDLLNQNRAITNILRENYIQNSETMIVNRYFMLGFIFNLKQFNAKK